MPRTRRLAAAWGTELAADRLGLCAQARLEILYSARLASDYAALDDELSSLVVIPDHAATWERAHQVQRRLAHVRGLHHRSVKIAALVIAAAAEEAGATVWHYDEDFERIAAITDQPISWIAPREPL